MTELRRVLLVHGLQRSGNHAIINWLRGQRMVAFFNNFIPTVEIYKDGAALPPPRNFADWLAEPDTALTLGDFDADECIVSLEDLDITVMPFTEVSCELLHVVILRDPYNLFASRVRRHWERHTYRRHAFFVGLWKKYARECLGRTQRVGNKLCVYYDQWFENEGYRRELSAKLGFDFSDSRFARVPPYGGGSSFDWRNYHGRASEMNVLDRRSDLTPHELEVLSDLLADPEVEELARALRAHYGGGAARTDRGRTRSWIPPKVELRRG